MTNKTAPQSNNMIKAQAREHGYYWVKINVGWRVLEWHARLQCWYHIGGLATFQDDDMQEINENRLLAPDERA